MLSRLGKVVAAAPHTHNFPLAEATDLGADTPFRWTPWASVRHVPAHRRRWPPRTACRVRWSVRRWPGDASCPRRTDMPHRLLPEVSGVQPPSRLEAEDPSPGMLLDVPHDELVSRIVRGQPAITSSTALSCLCLAHHRLRLAVSDRSDIGRIVRAPRGIGVRVSLPLLQAWRWDQLAASQESGQCWVMFSVASPPTIIRARPPIGKVTCGLVCPKSTLPSTGFPRSAGRRATRSDKS